MRQFSFYLVVSALLAALVACGSPQQGKTGRLDVVISGLPARLQAKVRVTGTGFDRSFTSTESVVVAAGSYSISAATLDTTDERWSATVFQNPVTVPANDSAEARIDYRPTSANLDVSVLGLPSNARAKVSLSGPSGFNSIFEGNRSFKKIEPGEYSLSGQIVTADSDSFAPEALKKIMVVGGKNNSADFTYIQAFGSLLLTLKATPSDFISITKAAVEVTGPANYRKTIDGTQVLSNLKPGDYTIKAIRMINNGYGYLPEVLEQTVKVEINQQTSVLLNYRAVSGKINVSLRGLPMSASGIVEGNLTITGSDGVMRLVKSSSTLADLAAGAYSVASNDLAVGSDNYRAKLSSSSVNVAIGAESGLSASYSKLIPDISNPSSNLVGLSSDVNAESSEGMVSIGNEGAAPLSYSTEVASNNPFLVTITGGNTGTLAAGERAEIRFKAKCAGVFGEYSGRFIIKSNDPDEAQKTVNITLSCNDPSNPFDLAIGGFYLTQSVQTLSRNVPLIAERSAYARAFVIGNRSRSMLDSKVTLKATAAGQSETFTLTGPSSAQTVIDESSLLASYNVAIPARLMKPGLELRLEVAAATGETKLDNNVLTLTPTIEALEPLRITVVPMLYQGSLPRIDSNALLDSLKRMMPVADAIDIKDHAPLMLNGSLSSGGDWNTWIEQIRDLRQAEGSKRYYYGYANTSSGAAYGGLGYVPRVVGGNWPVAVGGDWPDFGPIITAHEVGHNWGRLHAPCDVASTNFLDPDWPTGSLYAGAAIGVWGLDPFSQQPQSLNKKDVMSYCDNQWVSDYNYKAILEWRKAEPKIPTTPAPADNTTTLTLFNGRIDDQEQATLAPVLRFASQAAPLVVETGPYTLMVYDRQGRLLARQPFAAADLGHGQRQRHFALALALPAQAQLGRVVVLGLADQALASLTQPSASPNAPPLLVEKISLPAALLGQGAVSSRQRQALRLSWGGGAASGQLPANARVLVRDPASGEVLGLGNGQPLTVVASQQPLQVLLSTGLETTQTLIRW
jgi:hypothetical protein